jgi:hypothetical protein
LLDIEVVACAVVLEATKAVDVSVQLDNLFTAGARMKAINILGDE